MTLPIDRTALIAAQTNQVPGLLIQSAKNIAALQVPYDTIDELNTKVNNNYGAGATGTTQLADNAVTLAKMADSSVGTTELVDSSVTLAKMADSSVGTAELVDLSVTNAKVANGTLTAAKFGAGVLTNETANGLQIVALQADITQRMINVKYPPSSLTACAVDGVTDDTTAFNAIYQYAYDNGYSIFIGGVMRITAAIGKNLLLTTDRAFPSIFGNKAMAATNNLTTEVQDGSIILYDAVGGSALAIKNTSTAKFFYGGTIRDIAIVKQNGDQSTDSSIGLDLQGCVDYRLFNVACIGFDVGFKNTYGWSWDAFGMICVRNNIGVLLEDNSNAVGFHGSQIHQNKINIKILSGTNILFNKATLEGGNSIAVVITKGSSSLAPRCITFNNIYLEANAGGFIIGQDKNGVVSSAKIVGVTINMVNLETPGIVPFVLDNVDGVTIKMPSFGQTTDMISTTSLTKNVRVEDPREQYEASYLSTRYAVKNRIGYNNRVNLLPNGYLQFPDISAFGLGGLTAEFDTTTFAGETVVKITVPNGTTTNIYQRLMTRIDDRMVGKRLIFSGQAQKDSGMTATFTAYTPAYSGISGASVSIPTTMGEGGFYFTCPDEDYINISIVLANSSGSTKYVYIKSMVLVEEGTGEVQPNPIDYRSGFGGTVAATTGGTVVPLLGWKSDMYRVMLTERGNFTSYVTVANDQFTVTSSVNGNVFYEIIPRVGMFI